jgi:hypothetical protein
MAFKKQLVTSCKQAIWGEILGGNAPNYASDKTLQRLRVSGTIAYSNIRGRYFYKIGEIKRMLEKKHYITSLYA